MFQEVNDKCKIKAFIAPRELEINKKYDIVKFEQDFTEFGLGVMVELKDAKFWVPNRYIEHFTPDIVDDANEYIRQGAKIQVENRGLLEFNSVDLHFYGGRLFGRINKLTKYRDWVKPRELEIGKKYEILKFTDSNNSPYGPCIVLDMESGRISLPKRFYSHFTENIIQEANSKILSGVKIYVVSKGPLGQSTDLRIICGGSNNIFAAMNKSCCKLFVKSEDLESGKWYDIKNFATCDGEYGMSIVVELSAVKVRLPRRFVDHMSEEFIQKANEKIANGVKISLKSNGQVGMTTELVFKEAKGRGKIVNIPVN